MIGIVALFVLWGVSRIWRRRIPGQNLVMAGALIGLMVLALAGVLDPGIYRQPAALGQILLVAWATIPAARLAAAWGLRSSRRTARYGIQLNLLAGLMAAIPIGCLLQEVRTPANRWSAAAAGPVGLWLVLWGWAVMTLLLTLPLWLDKRRDGPGCPPQIH